MDENFFWQLITSSRAQTQGDPDQQHQNLSNLLQSLSDPEILAFDCVYQQKIIEAYDWRLWGAAYVINGGCSDDGFRYFCDWLIAQGRDVFEQALADPETLADLDDIEDAEAEEFGYLAAQVYQDRTGQPIPADNGPTLPHDPKGEPWDEEGIEELYPRLAERYW